MDPQSGALRRELISRPWWIGLERWVLQDGNYTDFVTGERRQFALEFGYARTKRLLPTSTPTEPQCRYSGHTVRYDVAGHLLRASQSMDEGFVLDFGLCAYKGWMVLDDLEPPEAGAWLTGEIYLSVDHFEYMDELAELPEMPPLIYTWTIDEIQVETTPQILVPYGHPLNISVDEGPILVPDPSRESWRTIDRTRAWEDESSYRLRCTLDNKAPTNSMTATGPASPYGPLTST